MKKSIVSFFERVIANEMSQIDGIILFLFALTLSGICIFFGQQYANEIDSLGR